MTYTDVLGDEYDFYCEVCGNYSNDECDCCLECMENIHECECERNN